MTDADDLRAGRALGDQPRGANDGTRDAPDAGRSAPPVTGEPDVDRALESLQGLETTPLAHHGDRLARVHEQLHAALDADLSTPEG